MTGTGNEADDTELFLVDCGVESLANVYLSLPKLLSLNLHSNYITKIENLNAVPLLTHLDLSSNQILRIEGLKYIPNLRHLNLSCNLLTIVEGLTTMSSLVSINLSYNQIVKLNGFRRIPASNCLTTVQLQGNSLTDINHVVFSLKPCQHLTCLVLQDGLSATNPLCSNSAYMRALKEQLPSLLSTERPPPNILEESVTSDRCSTATQSNSKAVVADTPRIDAVLERFRQGLDNHQITPTTSADSSPRDSGEVTPPYTDVPSSIRVQDQERKDLELQLQQLEKQLLKKKIESTELELQQISKTSPTKVHEKESPPKISSQTSSISGQKVGDARCRNSNNNACKQTSAPKRQPTRPANHAPTRKLASSSSDALYREAVNSTYQQLMKDLDVERTRRSKAEEAASKLAQQLRSFESETSEQQLARRNCDAAIDKLKRELQESRHTQEKALEVADKLQCKYRDMESQLRKSRMTCSAQEKSLSDHEKVQDKLERLRAESETSHREQTDQLTTSLYEQTELLRAARGSAQTQRAELDDLKSLLAAREADHRREMEQRYTLDSPKLEQLFQSKITGLVREQAAERKELQYRLEQSSRDYSELEDEFRMALQIEADRFQTLKTAFEDLSSNQSAQEKVLIACRDKDSRSNKIVTDLTQLVKEQKDKILSLSKEKQDLGQRVQGTKSRLEQQIENLNNKVKDTERLKRDNVELKNQVQGQHSIISGLRKERELWSKELAQQGASLSNERGTLEAKVETLTQECKTLRSNLDTEVDTVKIKTKLISDLTDSVSTLKQRIGQSEADNKSKESQLQTIRGELAKELEDERAHSADLEQEVERLGARKEELKTQLQCAEDELKEVKDSHRTLKNKWQDRSASISTLEEQVTHMRDVWVEKERKITDERDKAVTAADLALQRIRTMDDGFRKQLETKEISYEERVKELSHQYELTIAEHQHKVDRVEQEMRELLTERENSKRQLDDRMKKISATLLNIQQGGDIL